MAVLTLTQANFEQEVLHSKVPVLVDFWATWCGPCKMMGPVVEQIEKEMGSTVKIGKVNIDENTSLATKYNVMSIPTFMVFKDGKLVNSTVGVQDKENIKAMLR
ncbi:MAG: thioredoxin [Clostridia bacterium]